MKIKIYNKLINIFVHLSVTASLVAKSFLRYQTTGLLIISMQAFLVSACGSTVGSNPSTANEPDSVPASTESPGKEVIIESKDVNIIADGLGKSEWTTGLFNRSTGVVQEIEVAGYTATDSSANKFMLLAKNADAALVKARTISLQLDPNPSAVPEVLSIVLQSEDNLNPPAPVGEAFALGLVFSQGIAYSTRGHFFDDGNSRIDGFAGVAGNIAIWDSEHHFAPGNYRYGSITDSTKSISRGYLGRVSAAGAYVAPENLYTEFALDINLNYLGYNANKHEIQYTLNGWRILQASVLTGTNISSDVYNNSQYSATKSFANNQAIEFSISGSQLNSSLNEDVVTANSAINFGVFGNNYDDSYLAGSFLLLTSEKAAQLAAAGVYDPTQYGARWYWGVFVLTPNN